MAEIDLVNIKPVDYARNCCVSKARSLGVAWLVMIDNDCIPQDVLGVIAQAEARGCEAHVDIVGLACGTSNDKCRSFSLNLRCAAHKEIGQFVGVDDIGTGVMMIRMSSLLEKLPVGPWFCWEYEADELHATKAGEDNFFCRRAIAAGLSLWTHKSISASHIRSVDLTSLVGR
jgi:hypothetical protein